MVQLTLCILTCAPLGLSLLAWANLYWRWQWDRPRPIIVVALGVLTASSALACGTFFYYHFKPQAASLPPWQDTQTLNYALLGLSAPLAIVLGLVAAARGAPKLQVCLVELASLSLLVIGLFAGMSV